HEPGLREGLPVEGKSIRIKQVRIRILPRPTRVRTDVPTRPTFRRLDIARRLDWHVGRLCARHRCRRRKASRSSNQKTLPCHPPLLMLQWECRTTRKTCACWTLVPYNAFKPHVSRKAHFFSPFSPLFG